MRPTPNSMSHLLRMAALALCLAFAMPPAARAEVVIPGVEMSPHSGIDMKFTSVFKLIPQAGYATLQIYIRNNSGQPHSWTFQFVGNSYPQVFRCERTLTVADKAEQTFEVLVPLGITNNTSYSSNNIQISVNGYGIDKGTTNYNSSSSSGRSLTDFILMSQSLTVHSWGPLDKACEDKGLELLGCEFNPNYLPTDWRSYLGVKTMWITDTEWRGLDPIPRNAIRDWVFQGGWLTICSTNDAKAADYGFADGLPGYGRVFVEKWDGRELVPGRVVSQISSRDHSLVEHLASGYQTRWDLMGDIARMQFNGVFILLFVVCFGVVIGPLNFFWFAKTGRRHRLFWTIPLISVAGSLLLAGVIILEDGFGGEGNRMVLVQLLPGENEALITQEQISRTGLLISGDFKTEEKLFIVPISNLAPIPSFPGMTSKGNHGTYTNNPLDCAGDWFVSRSVQAQVMQVTRPSRSRMELIPGANGGAPTLLSSVENNLTHVFYIDDSGHFWSTGEMRVGEKRTLQPSTEMEFTQWIRSSTTQAGARINFLLDQAHRRGGYFYASAEDAKNEAVATLPGIRWNKAATIYLGPCAVIKPATP